jgi:hypothetical protein
MRTRKDKGEIILRGYRGSEMDFYRSKEGDLHQIINANIDRLFHFAGSGIFPEQISLS